MLDRQQNVLIIFGEIYKARRTPPGSGCSVSLCDCDEASGTIVCDTDASSRLLEAEAVGRLCRASAEQFF